MLDSRPSQLTRLYLERLDRCSELLAVTKATAENCRKHDVNFIDEDSFHACLTERAEVFSRLAETDQKIKDLERQIDLTELKDLSAITGIDVIEAVNKTGKLFQEINHWDKQIIAVMALWQEEIRNELENLAGKKRFTQAYNSPVSSEARYFDDKG